jgi:phosphomecalonate degydratase small subunit
MILKGRTIKAGKAEGEAIVAKTAFSFVGYLDLMTGKVGVGHDLGGQSIAGKILVFPTGMGSTGGAAVGYYAKLLGTAPIGMICIEAEPTIALNAIMNNIPTVDRLDKNPLEVIETGDHVILDATEGKVEVIKKR